MPESLKIVRNMKILLVMPPIENRLKVSNSRSFEPTQYGSFPPLGLLYIATFLKKELPDAEIYLFDCVAEQSSYSDVEKCIRSFNPDVVGMTVFSHCLVDVLKVARLVKSINSNTHVCCGGHHLTIYPRETLLFQDVDSIVIGEGEDVFCKLVRGLREGKHPKIEGLYFKEDRDSAEFIKAGISQIDELPFFDVGFLKRELYYSVAGNYPRVIPLLSSRGCPFRCNFCATLYKTYRSRSTKNIIEEIKLRLQQGFEDIFFFDDTFNITPQRVIEISQAILDHKLTFRWSFRARASAVTLEMLLIAKKAGCARVRFGVETGTDEGLRAIKKDISVRQIVDSLRWCRQVGITSTADYIIGFPFEKTKDDVRASIRRLIEFSPDFAQFNIFQLIPGSEIYDDAIKAEVVDPDAWSGFIKSPQAGFISPIWEQYLSRAELEELQSYAYRAFYFRPSYICKTLLAIRSFKEIKTACDAGLKMLLGK